jgi:hypothetical protein
MHANCKSTFASVFLALAAMTGCCAAALADEPGATDVSAATAAQQRQIEATMAAHPDDPEIQAAGAAALAALRDWQRQADRLEAQASQAAVGPGSESAALAANGSDSGSSSPEEPAVLYPDALSGLDYWDLGEEWVSLSVVDAGWAVDPMYHGTKAILTGQYSLRRGIAEEESPECDCLRKPLAQEMTGMLATELQWGDGDTGFEAGWASVTAKAYQRNFPLQAGELAPLRDTLELGSVLGGKDDPLGLNSYYEVTAARVGRTWAYQPQASPWILLGGVGASGGYAWAESANETYSDVSNPTIGAWGTLGIYRPGWGRLYAEQRVVNGFQLSSPSAGDPTSRTARFRAGYANQITHCLGFEVFIEKRSFNFSDHRLDDLYAKAKRAGVELSCIW